MLRTATCVWVVLAVVCPGGTLLSQPAPPQTGAKQEPAAQQDATKPGAKAAEKPAPPPVRDFTATRVLSMEGLSPEDALQVTEDIRLFVVYELGYTESDASAGTWQLRGDTTLRECRAFEKPGAVEVRRRLELGCKAFTKLGVRLVAAGSGRGRTSKEGLGDFEAVLKKIEERRKKLLDRQKLLGLRRHEVETIQLRYVKVDQALATLKVMGYTVVEFKENVFRKHPQASHSALAKTFDPVAIKDAPLPVIVRLIDADKTWLDRDTRKLTKLGMSVTPDVGGQDMPEVTSAVAQQRLLVVYDPNDTESIFRLKNLLAEHIDVAARQIVIEAMVIEIIESRLKDLGLKFSRIEIRQGGQMGLSFEGEDEADAERPFVLNFDDTVDTATQLRQLKITLRALLENGSAKILSRPSVLALDNHQARIRVGREIPIMNSVITTRTTSLNITYFPIGIVLNIKPRIGLDDSEVSLQIEAIVSSEDPDEKLTATDPNDTKKTITLAPFVDTRLVQTFARVTNGTPFIIGGLVADSERERTDRVPFISRLPVLGKLFQKRRTTDDRAEVIIVITPHVVPQDIRNFSYVVPKDTDAFDTLESTLFRSAYRLRGGDVFDLKFLYESDALQTIRQRVAQAIVTEPSLATDPHVAQFSDDQVPGESVLVKRQLYEIIKRLELYRNIRTDRIIFFKASEKRSSGFQVAWLSKEMDKTGDRLKSGKFVKRFGGSDHAFALLFKPSARGRASGIYTQPVASVAIEDLVLHGEEAPSDDEREGFLKGRCQETVERLNTEGQSAVVLANENDIDRLKIALIIKDLIKINSPQQSLRLKNFQVGKQLLFPSFPEDTRRQTSRKFYLVDHTVAQTFYETEFYYSAFEDQFNCAIEEASKILATILDGDGE